MFIDKAFELIGLKGENLQLGQDYEIIASNREDGTVFTVTSRLIWIGEDPEQVKEFEENPYGFYDNRENINWIARFANGGVLELSEQAMLYPITEFRTVPMILIGG